MLGKSLDYYPTMVIYLNAKACCIVIQIGQLLSSSPPNLKSLNQDFKELHLALSMWSTEKLLRPSEVTKVPPDLPSTTVQ